MTEFQEAKGSAPFKDRTTALILFGILEILLGVLCALIVPFMVLGMLASAALPSEGVAPMSAGMMAPAVLMYTGLAAWFISMGLGSIQARRWARALLLVSSWMWLIGGIAGLVFLIVLMPDMYDGMAESGQLPAQVAVIMKYAMIAFMTAFGVVLPGVLVLFYGNRHVKATCEFKDARVRWTDKCPLPVLAVSLLFALWAGCMPLMGFYGWVFPFFGLTLNGPVGAGACLAAMLIFAYTAQGTYRLSIKAWWCAVLLTIAWALSTGVTFSRGGHLDFYERMNIPEQQLEMFKQYGALHGSAMACWFALWFAGFLGYLLYTRRYFTDSPKQENA